MIGRRPRCQSCSLPTDPELLRLVNVCPACGRTRTDEDVQRAVDRAGRSRFRIVRWFLEAAAGLR